MSLRAHVLRAALALTTTAGLVVAAPAPAQAAAPLCFGPPSIPAAFVCFTPSVHGVPEVRDEGASVTVPGICYGVDCTPDTVQAVPTVHIFVNDLNAGTLSYMGRDYEIPGLTATFAICEAFSSPYIVCH